MEYSPILKEKMNVNNLKYLMYINCKLNINNCENLLLFKLYSIIK